MDDDITSKMLKFVDDTKVSRKIKSDADRHHLLDDLNKLTEWSEKWQMLFNFGKRKCVFIVRLHSTSCGMWNENAQYTMGDTILYKYYRKGKGIKLVLTINADMKVSEQCGGIAAAKGNQILGVIRPNIVYKKKLTIPLYKTTANLNIVYKHGGHIARRILIYLKEYKGEQHKMIQKLRDISYEMHLKECGLTTLETRRLRGDQIEMLKILNGYKNIDRNMCSWLRKGEGLEDME